MLLVLVLDMVGVVWKRRWEGRVVVGSGVRRGRVVDGWFVSGRARSARRRVGRGKVSKIVGGMLVGGERRMYLSCEVRVQVL